ncbi:hypothetical protein PINS_up023397, partial [Pythium insidiosum]
GHEMLFSHRGVFGVDSNHFEVVFVVRQLIDVALQAYQAYVMSHLVPRKTLNRGYVALLILNCWSTSLLLRMVKTPAMRRFLCILLHIVLGLISSIGIPAFLAVHYYADYDPTLTTFPSRKWFSDRWRIYIVNESSIMLFASWFGAFSRLMFSVSVLLALDDAKHIIKRRRVAIVDNTKTQKPQDAGASTTHSLIERWGHRLIVLLGCVILALQIHAESKPEPQACEVEVRPWLVSGKACALVQLSCHPNAKPRLYNGDTNDWKTVFTDLDPDSLLMIGVRHCPNVDITPQIQHFPNIFVLKFYNCTINSWPQDAVVSSQHHPKLVSIFAIRTNFPGGTIPPGMMPPDGHSLPSNLDQHWPKYLTLFLGRMSVYMLVLSGNQLTSVGSDVIMLKSLQVLAIRHMNISSLPEAGVDLATMKMGWFYMDNTTLTDLPSWMNKAFFAAGRVVQAAGTPICKTILAESAIKASGQSGSTPVLDARPWLSKFTTSYYPLVVENRADEVW